jgi:synaptobrevin family protein YKT6
MICEGQDYPSRVAFNLLNKIIEDYSSNPVAFDLKAFIEKFQNPHEADSILKVQKELDETKVILHKTIESVLDRGEKLDHLVAQSEQLSSQSKKFYTVAKKTNSSCCSFQ